jgi:hypothetical protein
MKKIYENYTFKDKYTDFRDRLAQLDEGRMYLQG